MQGGQAAQPQPARTPRSQATSADAVQAEHLLSQSDLYAESGRWSSALEAARAAVSLVTVDPDRLTRCLAHLLEHGLYAEAIDLLEELHRRSPGRNARLVNTLGALYAYSGKSAKARALFEIAASIEPANASVQTNLGSVHWESGEFRAASECWIRALSSDPAQARADYLYQYMQATHSRQYAEAVIRGPRDGKLIVPCLPSFPPTPEVYDVLLKQGKFRGAMEIRFPESRAIPLFLFAQRLKIVTASWDNGGMYLCTGLVIDADAARRSIHVSIQDTSFRVQRRRLIRILAFDGTGGRIRLSPDRPPEQVELLTISAGGVSFRAPWFIPRGHVTDVTLQLGETAMQICARIVWVKALARQHAYGAEFLVPENVRDEIARFIHRRQLALRRGERR